MRAWKNRRKTDDDDDDDNKGQELFIITMNINNIHTIIKDCKDFIVND